MYSLIYKRISKHYFLLIIIWLLSGHGITYAQETTTAEISEPSGIVTDQYGRPVQGVEISVKKGDYKMISGVNGLFDIEKVYGATLILSHPDYLVKEIKAPKDLKKGKVFKIHLTDKKLQNPETIDIPYRGTIDKNSYLGTASTIYSEEIASTLSANILGAIAGRISGLNITQTRGFKNIRTESSSSLDSFVGWRPNLDRGNYSDNTQFNYILRGVASPILIVDGLESDLFNIDVESIESISLQKDALSSMFMGGRSSRGVMYITTKKPVAEGFKVSFTGRYGLQEPIKMPKPLSAIDYTYLLNEALVNDGSGSLYSSADLEKYRTGSSPYTHPGVNWYDKVLKNSSAIQSYNLNATGGGKVAQYFVSLGYMSEEGLFRQASGEGYDTNAKYERYMITSKINVNILDNLKMTATVIGRIEDDREPGVSTNTLFENLYNLPGTVYPVYNEEGSFSGVNGYGLANPVAQAQYSGYKTANARDGMGTVNLDHNMSWLTEGLSARFIGSVASQSRSAISRTKAQALFSYDQPTDSYTRVKELVTQSNNYIGVANFQYMYGQVGVDYARTLNDTHSIGGTLSADLREALDNFQLPERYSNIYGEAKYDYKKRYFAQASVNRSYLNRYGPGKRWGTFYAFGLGWDISKEEFMSDVEWVNKLKFRGTFGETGNAISRSSYYEWRQQYRQSGNYSHGSGYTGGTTGTGIIEVDNKLANPYLTWERAHKLNVGLDANLFNNKLWITADFYRDSYFDLLRERGKSIQIIGLAYPYENIGKNTYKGVDLSVTYQNNVGTFNYYVTANWNTTQSEVKFIDEQYVPHEYMRRTGNPVGTRYGLVAEGLFQSAEEIANSAVISGYTIMPGDIKYKDLNGDNVINEFDITKIGGDKPLSTFGIDLGFEYKGFEVSALFQGAYNREISIADAGQEFLLGFMAGNNGYSQAYEHALLRWTPETASTATFPRLSTKNNGLGATYNINPNYWGNSYWIRSGNFIRLKNLSIAYTLPDSFSRACLGGAKIKIFVTGQNIWTQAACSLVDPEIINFKNYPMMRGFNTGVNIKF